MWTSIAPRLGGGTGLWSSTAENPASIRQVASTPGTNQGNRRHGGSKSGGSYTGICAVIINARSTIALALVNARSPVVA